MTAVCAILSVPFGMIGYPAPPCRYDAGHDACWQRWREWRRVTGLIEANRGFHGVPAQSDWRLLERYGEVA